MDADIFKRICPDASAGNIDQFRRYMECPKEVLAAALVMNGWIVAPKTIEHLGRTIKKLLKAERMLALQNDLEKRQPQIKEIIARFNSGKRLAKGEFSSVSAFERDRRKLKRMLLVVPHE